MKIYLIYVHYGESYKNNMYEICKKLGEVELITVNTKSNSILGINDRNEFSGYKYGISKIKPGITEGNIRIIFVNDTFFYGHLRPFAQKLLNQFVNSNFERGLFNGVLSSFGSISYNSTWLFSIDLLEVSHIGKIQFYSRSLNKKSFPFLYLKLNKSYQDQIQRWLYPTNIMKGWHKSSHRFQISRNAFYEKAFMIYLEHTLPRRLNKLKYIINDAIGESFLLRILFLFDRIQYILKKIKTRIYRHI